MSYLKEPPFFGETQVQAETSAVTEGQPSQGNSHEAILKHKSGHFHLPLTVLRTTSDQRSIQLKKERLSDQLNNPDEVECTKLALLNLISVFEYALQQTDKARKVIQDTLEIDSNNVNALQNLAYINRELGLESVAKQLEAKTVQFHGSTDFTRAEPSVKARVARSMAEQAFALAFDCFDKDEDEKGTDQLNKYQMADPLYQNAINIGNGVVGAEERMAWSFFKAFNHQQICGQYNVLYVPDDREMMTVHLGKSIASYKDVLQQEPTPLYRAQTLVYLKCLQSRTMTDYYVRQTDEMLPIISKFQEEITTLLDGQGSISNAIALVRNNHRVLNTMASALRFENFVETEETVKASLETESDPKINWYGYHLRGELTLAKYMSNKARTYSQKDHIQLLKDSISDFQTCSEGMHSFKTYYLLGKAIMNLAEAESGVAPLTSEKMANRQHTLIKALQYFTEGLKLDQGPRDAKLHAFRAKCLQHLKEDKQAVESWKRAVEVGRDLTYWGNISQLLAMLLNKCKETEELESRQPFVAETATYLKVALSKYRNVYDEFIPQLIQQFPEEFLQAANYFRITNDFIMARRILDYVNQVSQTIRWLPPLHQERRRRIEQEVDEREEAFANVASREPGSKEHDEQTAASDLSEEGATGGEVLEEPPPATEEQRAFLPKKVEKAKNTEGLHYDFFVIHSAKDAEWVNYTLLSKLEGEHCLKGCIADRDFQLGELVLNNITESIKQSAKVLIILTPNLVQSRWCEYEMKTAFHVSVEKGTKSVIPVLLMDCEVPDELKTITYLDAREHFDWEHLLRDIQQ